MKYYFYILHFFGGPLDGRKQEVKHKPDAWAIPVIQKSAIHEEPQPTAALQKHIYLKVNEWRNQLRMHYIGTSANQKETHS